MTPATEIVMARQRTLIQSMNSDLLKLRMTIIAAASHIYRDNPEAAIDLIIRASEDISNETANHNTRAIG